MKIDKARFRKPITPGDQIRMEVKKEKAEAIYGSFMENRLLMISWLVKQVLPQWLLG